MFASSLAVTMSVTAFLKDQNDKIILNKFTVDTLCRVNTEMVCYLSAAKFNSLFFFLPPPQPDATSGIRETTYQFVVAKYYSDKIITSKRDPFCYNR